MLYTTFIAVLIVSSTSLGADFHVPRPSAGILAPVFNSNDIVGPTAQTSSIVQNFLFSTISHRAFSSTNTKKAETIID